MKSTLGMLRIALAAALWLASPVAEAQEPDERPAAQQGEKRERIKKLRDKVLRGKVGLDGDKAHKVEKILRQHRDKQRVIKKEIREAKDRLRALLKEDSGDDGAFDEALAKLRAAHKSLALQRDADFEELRKVLTAKEQAKLLRALLQLRQHLRAQVEGRAGGKGRGPSERPQGREKRKKKDFLERR